MKIMWYGPKLQKNGGEWALREDVNIWWNDFTACLTIWHNEQLSCEGKNPNSGLFLCLLLLYFYLMVSLPFTFHFMQHISGHAGLSHKKKCLFKAQQGTWRTNYSWFTFSYMVKRRRRTQKIHKRRTRNQWD